MRLHSWNMRKLVMVFLSHLLEATNTVNLDEGAELIQRHTCNVLKELGREELLFAE